jgi:hypothetical protein
MYLIDTELFLACAGGVGEVRELVLLLSVHARGGVAGRLLLPGALPAVQLQTLPGTENYTTK